MTNSKFNNLTYLFPNSKTYFKFAVDENGLWVIFASDIDDSVRVAKLSTDSFSVETVINTAYPSTKSGNAFIVDGIVYFTENTDTRITHAFDLKREIALDVGLNLRSNKDIMAMLSYYPNKRLLFMWENSHVKLCKVKLRAPWEKKRRKCVLNSVFFYLNLHCGGFTVTASCVEVACNDFVTRTSLFMTRHVITWPCCNLQ